MNAGRLTAWLRSRVGRGLAVVLVTFFLGYLVATGLLFPRAGDPTDTPLIPVSDFTGLTFADASGRIEEAGLEAVVRTRMRHATEVSEVVLAQSPLPGQLAQPGSDVALTLSDGPEVVTVPALEGLAMAQAAELLRAMGFEVEIRRAEVRDGRTGVRGTDPEAGTLVTLPTRVELLVSEGAPVVQVPDLRGRHIDDIEGLLTDADLQLGALRYDPEATQAADRVVSHTPPPGWDVRAGAFVSVLVAGEAPDSVPEDPSDGPGEEEGA
jgi:serine/threonine-protein kinase